MSAFGGKADIPSAPILWAHGSPLAAQNRTEDGPPPLSKCRTKAQCRFGLRSGSFSCHWYKALVSSHPAGSEILSSSLWLRAIVGVSLRAHQTQLKPPQQAVAAVRANAEQRAANLRTIVDDLRAQGITSVRAVAAELNERGILTPRGGAWHPTSASRLLSRLRV